MSPSFRNLFSSDDGNARSASDSGSQGGTPAGKGQVFLISEILPYIPPAIVARSGIPMELSVSVPLPENGSREVRLSVLHHLCPALFAAEITPMNDLTITLPPRIGVKADPMPHQVNLRERPLFQKTSVSSSAPPTSTGATTNPFRPRRSETGAGISGGGTLFIRKAAEDADLPSPQAKGGSGGDLQATWGSLFLDKVREPAAKTETPPLAPAVDKKETPPSTPMPVSEEKPLMEQAEADPLAPMVAKAEAVSQPAESVKPEGLPLAPLALSAEIPPQVPVMAKPKRLTVAPVAVNPEIPSLAPVMVNPTSSVPQTVAKAPSHVFERLDEDDYESVAPAPAVAPNPWAAVEALRPATGEQSRHGETTANRSAQASKPSEGGLIFRAMFGTEDDFDLDRLAQALLNQSGIDSVVLSIPPRLVEASLESAEKLGEKALELIEATRSLGRLVGMDNDAFSFQADRGYISLFTHGQQAIVVRHAEARLSPGLRERLLLSVRHLDSLAG